jgi:spermidine synthase
VTVATGDVLAVAKRNGPFDAIMLDVDNGPIALTDARNAGLYSLAGLRAFHGALKRRGYLSVWSAGYDERFDRRLREAGFSVTHHEERARAARSGARHVVWIARA